MSSEEDRLLEIYKLHADLADRVSQRREGANRLYSSLQVGLVVFLAALLRFGFGDAPAQAVVATVGCIGALLSLSWFAIIISYRQLNREKFRVLQALENRLPYQFFKDEYDPKGRGKKSNTYRALTKVESFTPLIFLALFLSIVLYGICFL